MTSSAGTKRTIHQSLIRPVLFGGAERGVSVLSVSAAIGIPMFAGLHVLTVGIALVFALPLHALGVWLARRDPQMIAVYLRSLSASDHYVPWGGRCPRSTVVHPSIPGA
ncbi:MAG: VirB3 family type IV secretion system protein [Longimicrobiales bacterium]